MCLYNLDKLADAKAEFRKAMSDDRSRTLAQQWVKVIESDEARLEQLRIARAAAQRAESADD